MPYLFQLKPPDGREILITEVWRGPKPAPPPSTRSSGDAVDVDIEVDGAAPIRETVRADLLSLRKDELIAYLRGRGHI